MVMEVGSREYVHATVTAPAGVDITGTPPEIAIVAHEDSPAESDWRTAAWTDGTTARILVGPGGTVTNLTKGEYRVHVRFTAGAERPAIESGILILT